MRKNFIPFLRALKYKQIWKLKYLSTFYLSNSCSVAGLAETHSNLEINNNCSEEMGCHLLNLRALLHVESALQFTLLLSCILFIWCSWFSHCIKGNVPNL